MNNKTANKKQQAKGTTAETSVTRGRTNNKKEEAK
jgi:hypothetical protein